MQYEAMCNDNGTAAQNPIIPTLSRYSAQQLRPKPIENNLELRIDLPEPPAPNIIEAYSGLMSPRALN